MANLKTKLQFMVPTRSAEKIETPFGIYDPLDSYASDSDMARLLNSTSSEVIVDAVTPNDIVSAITPMATHTPKIEGDEHKVVTLKLYNSELVLRGLNCTWSIDEPTDRLLSEITTDTIKIPSYELINKINQQCYENTALISDNGMLMFRKFISLEEGVTQLNLLYQLNGHIKEANYIIEQIMHGDFD